jgi:hypothetical protein
VLASLCKEKIIAVWVDAEMREIFQKRKMMRGAENCVCEIESWWVRRRDTADDKTNESSIGLQINLFQVKCGPGSRHDLDFWVEWCATGSL